jgi:hypothetical protein
MAWRLGDYLEIGELSNFKKNSVFGRLKLRGMESTVMVELTGDFDPDLRGKRVEFQPGNNPYAPPGRTMRKSECKGLAMHQIGPTGTMTASHEVKLLKVPVEAFCNLPKEQQDEACVPVRCLYLEWFSQNGRVVIELPDPILTISDSFPQEDEDETVDEAASDMAEHPSQRNPEDDDADEQEPGFITEVRLDEDEGGLWDAEEEEPDGALDECVLMDDLIDNDPGVQLRTLLSPKIFETDVDELCEQKAEGLLKGELVRLAQFGIALHMCEHYSARDALKLLMSELGREGRPFPALRGTGWVTNYLTSDFCPQCDAEFEARYEKEEQERRLREEQQGTPPNDEDCPF